MTEDGSARVPLVEVDESDPQVAALCEQVRALGRDLPNLYRVLSTSATVQAAWVHFAGALRNGTAIPPHVRELMILWISRRTRAEYEWAHHWEIATAVGVPADELSALAAPSGDHVRTAATAPFGPGEQTVLAFADEVAAGAVNGTAVAALRAHWPDQVVVELAVTAAFYVMVSAVLDALQVPIEADHPAYPPIP